LDCKRVRRSSRDAEVFEELFESEDDIPKAAVAPTQEPQYRRSSRDAEVFEEAHNLVIKPTAMSSTFAAKIPLPEGDIERRYPTGKVMPMRKPSGRDKEFFDAHDDEPMIITRPFHPRTRSGRDDEVDVEHEGTQDDEATTAYSNSHSVSTRAHVTRARRASGRDAEFDEEVALAHAPLSSDYACRELRTPSGRDAEYFGDEVASRKRRASRDAELFDQDDQRMLTSRVPFERHPSGRDLEY